MAVIRSELTNTNLSSDPNRSTYDAVVTRTEDLSGTACMSVFGIGSMVYCLEDEKLYIKDDEGEWQEVGR